MMVNGFGESSPFMAEIFRLVKYSNLPRYTCVYIYIYIYVYIYVYIYIYIHIYIYIYFRFTYTFTQIV